MMASRWVQLELFPDVVLHLKEFSAFNSGPHIRKCTECGVRLWIERDGVWTDNRSQWQKPPSGYINCRDAREKERKR